LPSRKVSLVVSFLGFESKTVAVSEIESKVIIRLTETTNQLSDVVIVGIQAQTKSMSTSAFSTILSKDIENLPAPSVDQLLQGKVAGLNVQVGSGEPGVAHRVLIRGNSKVNTNIGDNPMWLYSEWKR